MKQICFFHSTAVGIFAEYVLTMTYMKENKLSNIIFQFSMQRKESETQILELENFYH
jgi:hypothetical protein